MRVSKNKLNRWRGLAAAVFAAVIIGTWCLGHRLSPAGATALCAWFSVWSGMFWAFAAALPPRRRRLAQGLNFLAACCASAAGIGLVQ